MTNHDPVDEILVKLENDLSSSDETNEVPPADIISFNEQRSCSDLVRLYENKNLDIQPDFQREEVWSGSSKTRFIDSLAKELPIPSMCLALDYPTNNRVVVDGLQRLSSIISFLTDGSWKLSKLKDIDQNLSNKTVDQIKKSSPDLYSKIESLSIPLTVVRCDLSKKEHQEFLFTIFHRLNTGGAKLNNQEIRNCIYQGTLNSLLHETVKSQKFQTIFNISEDKTYRFSNEELLLRAIAFSTNLEKYQSPLNKYLNDFMSDNRDTDTTVFRSQLDILLSTLSNLQPLPSLSKAITEALLVAIIKNRDTIANKPALQVQKAFNILRKDPLFSTESLKEGLAATEKVKARLTRAIEIFS